ncbi:MAG: gamma-glutamyl-gamma-aminobutyrate hydrolase family protein [Clostridia bacterium]|nr:gamma-glutamyl-gamma-aminobutyrate hydrolase family protein [Clostridia bacterium]
MRLIGLTPSQDEKTGRITVNQDYLDAVLRAGAAPALLPLTDDEKVLAEYLRRIDGLLLTGGADVGPEMYGEKRLPLCGETAPLRDKMEFPLCRMALDVDKPILAICRGFQVLSCVLGGDMYQDIEAQFNKELKHPRFDRPGDKVHDLLVEEGSLLQKVTRLDSFRVNSRHHQAIRLLGAGLVPDAYAPDGLLESAHMPGRTFVLGVQWHPETLSDRYPEAQALFSALTEACGT